MFVLLILIKLLTITVANQIITCNDGGPKMTFFPYGALEVYKLNTFVKSVSASYWNLTMRGPGDACTASVRDLPELNRTMYFMSVLDIDPCANEAYEAVKAVIKLLDDHAIGGVIVLVIKEDHIIVNKILRTNKLTEKWRKINESISKFHNGNDLIRLTIALTSRVANRTLESCRSPSAASSNVPNKSAEDETDPMQSFSKTSVLFVSVSFIILMVISLAWLVFYYVQRFRYAHAKDRLARRLFNAAKKALSKMPTKSLKVGDPELETDCPVCIEPYHQADVIRVLPCKHVFHKTCVDPWLLEHRTCPMCKMDILKAFGYTLTHSCDSVRVQADPDRLSGGGNSSDGRESSGGVSFSAYPFTGAATDSDLHDPFFPSPAPSPPLLQQVLHEGQAQGFSIIPLTVHSTPAVLQLQPIATASDLSGSSTSSHIDLAAKSNSTHHRKRPASSRHTGSSGRKSAHSRQYSAEIHPPPPLLFSKPTTSSSDGFTSGSGGASCESSGSDEDLGKKSIAVSESLFTPRSGIILQPVGSILAQSQSKHPGRYVLGKSRRSSLSVGRSSKSKARQTLPTDVETPEKPDMPDSV